MDRSLRPLRNLHTWLLPKGRELKTGSPSPQPSTPQPYNKNVGSCSCSCWRPDGFRSRLALSDFKRFFVGQGDDARTTTDTTTGMMTTTTCANYYELLQGSVFVFITIILVVVLVLRFFLSRF